MAQRKWSKQKIVDRLRSWNAEGVPTKSLWRQDVAMTSRATSLFGSWRNALAAAGIESARRTWDRETIIEGLQATRGKGLPADPRLIAAAVRHFGTIRAASKAAGVPCLTRTPPHQDWTCEKAVAEIQKRHASGQRLRSTARDDPALYAAAKRLFGTWTAARAVAGHPIPGKIVMATDEVLKAIRTQHDAGGSLPGLRASDPLLERSAKHHFGSWTGAVDAAGFRRKRRQRWNKQTVIAAIQKRHANGLELNKTWIEDKSLFRAGCLHLGSWRTAVRIAGFEPIKAERWSKQRIIDRLRAWRERTDDTVLAVSDQALASACCRFFGSHDAAFEAAGIEITPRRWTKPRIVAAIQDRYIAGKHLDRVGFGDERLNSAAKRHFGSWAAAVEAAGLTDRVELPTPLQRWNEERVISEIRAWHDSGHRLAEVSRKYQALFNAAKTHFGGWNNAIIAADLEPERRFYTKPEIPDMIRARHDSGQSLCSGHPDNRNLAMLRIRHFGSWRKGLAAAGVVEFGRKRRAAS